MVVTALSSPCLLPKSQAGHKKCKEWFMSLALLLRSNVRWAALGLGWRQCSPRGLPACHHRCSHDIRTGCSKIETRKQTSYQSGMQSIRVGKWKTYTQTGCLSWTLKLVLGYNQFEWPTEPACLFVCMLNSATLACGSGIRCLLW